MKTNALQTITKNNNAKKARKRVYSFQEIADSHLGVHLLSKLADFFFNIKHVVYTV